MHGCINWYTSCTRCQLVLAHGAVNNARGVAWGANPLGTTPATSAAASGSRAWRIEARRSSAVKLPDSMLISNGPSVAPLKVLEVS